MRANHTIVARAGVLALALLVGGCGKKIVFTEVEGTVRLNGQPLPNVHVEFVPMIEGINAQFNSVGVTDEQGHFTLSCGDKRGALVGRHVVLVREGPLPPEARGQSEKAQAAYTAHMQKLRNRPIPARYGSVAATNLDVEVTPSQTSYALELTRP